MTYNIKQKIYPSSVSAMDGDLCLTKYPSGCHRNILAKAAGYIEQIPETSQQVGEVNENNFIYELCNNTAVTIILWEIPFKQDIISGRLDFMVWYDDEIEPQIYELKGTCSSNTLKLAENNTPPINYVAQVVVYLLAHNQLHGYLCFYGYTKKIDNTTGKFIFVPKKSRKTNQQHKYKLKIDISTKEILINDRKSGYDVDDIVQHIITTKDMLKHPEVKDRPFDVFDGSYPCFFCKLSSACDKYDSINMNSTDQFLDLIFKENIDAT